MRAGGDLIKILWHAKARNARLSQASLGLSLYAKRLERGRFIWPSASGEAVAISAAQLAYMFEGTSKYPLSRV